MKLIFSNSLEKGFTAVELLITLFIASVFLFAGYQLYTQVTREGSSANRDAIVSNNLYEKMRKKAAVVSDANPNGCSAGTLTGYPTTTIPETVAGVGSVTFKTYVTCPQGTTPVVDVFHIKVEASFTINGTSRTLTHATYTN